MGPFTLFPQEEVFLTIAKSAAIEAAQSGAAVGKTKDLPFCSTFLKVRTARADAQRP